jgi:hypothetical protein
MKLHKVLTDLNQSIQGITGIKSGLNKIFAQLKEKISFYSVPLIAIVQRIAFILSITLIGQLFISLIKLVIP